MTGYFTMRRTYLLSSQCTRSHPLLVVFLHALSGEISPNPAYLVFSIVFF